MESSNPQNPLFLVGLGCGSRTRTYCELAARYPERYQIVAGADPVASRVEELRRISRNPGFRSFQSDSELFAAGKLGDVCIIGTQDSYHVEPALRAMELGYDLLLEKPIAPESSQILQLLDASQRLGRKVMVCHVLRYTALNEKIKSLLQEGHVGQIVTIDAREGVGRWHQAHSYVRGHWAITGDSSPMIIAKSCHDLDLISWYVDRPCKRVSSYGSLEYFVPANAPAGAPARCTDGCPVGDTCPFNALRYITDQRVWLYVMDGHKTATPEEITEWLKTSNWGRCVYRCDNDAVDRQVLAMQFEGGVTGTFTMTGFDEGRDVAIAGTEGTLRAGHMVKSLTGHDIVVTRFEQEPVFYDIPVVTGGYQGHGGGDPRMIDMLDAQLALPREEMRSGLDASVESHLIGLAAERSRVEGRTVELAELRGETPVGLAQPLMKVMGLGGR